MNSEPDNPYAAPTSDPAYSVIPPEGPVLATPGDRFGGALIDGLISIPIVFAIWGVLYLTGKVESYAEFTQLGIVANLLVGLVSFGLFLAVQGYFLNATGQTLGKKAVRTRIVTLAGEKPSMTDLIFKRYAFMNLIGLIPVAGSILALVNVLFVFRKDRRCLHDLIADTRVVKLPSKRPVQFPAGPEEA